MFFLLGQLVGQSLDGCVLIDRPFDICLSDRRGRSLLGTFLLPHHLHLNFHLAFLRLHFGEFPADGRHVLDRVLLAEGQRLPIVGPDCLGELSQGLPPCLEHFGVPILGFPEHGVAVRSPLEIHVDDFFHIGFLDRVDDARERLGIVAAQGDLHDLRGCDELDDQLFLEPRDRIDLRRIMGYSLTFPSWRAVFSTIWLLTRVCCVL